MTKNLYNNKSHPTETDTSSDLHEDIWSLSEQVRKLLIQSHHRLEETRMYIRQARELRLLLREKIEESKRSRGGI